MRPAFKLLADGRDITANIRDRLLSIACHDEAEAKSDRLTIQLDDRPRPADGAHVALPDVGCRLELSLGYEETGMLPMGSFLVDEVEHSGPPETLKVGAKAADMVGPFRTPTSRSWDATTLGAIVQEVARAHGYQARLDPALAAVPVAHEDQTNESPMAFLHRLAERHDAVVKPVNGMLVLAPKGKAKAVSGKALPEAVVRMDRLSKWTYSYKARAEAGKAKDARGPAGGVQTAYWDKDAAAQKQAQAGAPPHQNTRFACADAKAAAADAAGTKNRKDRGSAKFSCTTIGDPRFMAEQKLRLQGFRPGLPTEWRVTTVEHRFDANGYAVDITAELFTPEQEDVGKAASTAGQE